MSRQSKIYSDNDPHGTTLMARRGTTDDLDSLLEEIESMDNAPEA